MTDTDRTNVPTPAEKEERLKRILSLYQEIVSELNVLKKEGAELCEDFHGIIDHSKLNLVKQKINKNKN